MSYAKITLSVIHIVFSENDMNVTITQCDAKVRHTATSTILQRNISLCQICWKRGLSVSISCINLIINLLNKKLTNIFSRIKIQ